MLEKWRWINKTCVACGNEFACKSTHRRTQWCPTCQAARERYKAIGHQSSARLSELAKKAGESCADCGATGQQLHHVVKLADGGDFDKSNLIYLCTPCHQKRHRDREYIFKLGVEVGKRTADYQELPY